MKSRIILTIMTILLFTAALPNAFSEVLDVFQGSNYMGKKISKIDMGLVLLRNGDIGIRTRITSPKKDEYIETCSRISRIKYCNIRAYLDYFDELDYDELSNQIYWDNTVCANVENFGQWNQKINLTGICSFKIEKEGDLYIVTFKK